MLTTRPAPTQTRSAPTQDAHALTPGEREWIRRQGRAARTFEARQRGALRAHCRAPLEARRPQRP